MTTTPSFVTGARILIKVGTETMVFGVATSIRTSATVVKPNVLGQYGPAFIQKVMQGPVQGSFTILKVLNTAARTELAKAATAVDHAKDALNPAGLASGVPNSDVSTPMQSDAPGVDPGTITSMAGANNSPLTVMFKDHMDASRVLLSTAVDIVIYHRYPTTDNKFQDAILFTVKNCRLTSRSTSISPGSLVNESFNFTGLLLDDASGKFKLDESGF